jgi:hypothetical protein
MRASTDFVRNNILSELLNVLTGRNFEVMYKGKFHPKTDHEIPEGE